jgi:hypothetical protein
MEKYKGVIIFVVVCLFFVICFYIVVSGYKDSILKAEEYELHIEKIYGNIQFKGKVLNVHKVKRWGRTCGIMCIELDSTNTNEFYRFENLSCLKIKNDIITLPTGPLSNDAVKSNECVNAILSAIYIEVNMDTNKQMCFIDSAGNRFYQDLYFRSSNLKEEDMLLCDDCEENK